MTDKEEKTVGAELADHPIVAQLRKEQFSDIGVKAPFTLALAGDVIQSHPFSKRIDPDVRAVLDVVKNSDAAFCNIESNFGDYRNATNAIGGLQGCKEVAKDIRDMGFGIVARSSNHSTDQGVDEMLKGNKYLQEAGIVYSGSGINLEDARAPQYMETPYGRIGIVAMCMNQTGRVGFRASTSAAAGMEMAAYGAGNRNGIPGLNFLRTVYNVLLPKEQFEEILKIKKIEKDFIREQMENAGMDNTGGQGETMTRTLAIQNGPAGDPSKRQRIGSTWFQLGEEKDRCKVHYDMNSDDLRLNMRSIREGKEWSDLMIASIHSHDHAYTTTNIDFLQREPSDFMIELAHQSIDNGADIFVATGPHLLRGIEFYKGKPIFYSLSSFVYQLYGVPAGPDRCSDMHEDPYYTETTGIEYNMDMWPPLSVTNHKDLKNMESMESAVAELKYKQGKLREIIMHPLEFGYDVHISQKGIPRKPTHEVAQRILSRLQKMCSTFGTNLEIKGDLGIISASNNNIF